MLVKSTPGVGQTYCEPMIVLRTKVMAATTTKGWNWVKTLKHEAKIEWKL